MLVKENFEIKNLTTYKVGGIVKKIYFPETVAEFISLLKELDEYIVLGGCSNIIFSSNGYNGNVILTTNLKKYEINGSKVVAECGVKGALLSQKVCEHSLSGFEFMIGFPGTIGGNVIMNAGAHGQTISDVFCCACLFDKEKKEIIYKNKEDMDFSYRHSMLQNSKYILLSAEFDLKIEQQENIRNLMERNLSFRKEIQPSLATPNAGSVFRNPENDSAGRLLDKAGVKNITVNNVEVWSKHANFIVNKGNASSENILELMAKMYDTVKEVYTIQLQPEQILVGNLTEKEEELCKKIYKIKIQK